MRKLILFFPLFIILALVGCSRFEADKSVATIDNNPITEQDFVNEYLRHIKVTDIQHRAKMETEEDAKKFLNDLISARVIALEAEAEGFAKRPNIADALNGYIDDNLVSALREYSIKDLTVTEDEVKQAYENMKVDVNVSLIAFDDEGTAQKVLTEVKASGADFAALARKYSVDPLSKDKGGVLPTLRYYPTEPWNSIYAAKAGDIVGPIAIPGEQDRYGIFLIGDKVVVQSTDRPPYWAYLFQRDVWRKIGREMSSREPLPPFEKVKPDLQQQMMEVKKAEAFEKYKKELLTKYPLERHQDVLDLVYKGDPATWRRPENRDKIVATVAGRPIYFKTWFEGAMLTGDLPKMRKDNPKQFTSLMEGRLLTFWKYQATVAEALALGLDKKEETAKDIARQKMRLLGETYLDEKLAVLLKHPTTEQIEEYYNRNRDKDPDLKTQEQISGYMIMANDRTTADQLHDQAIKGTKLEDISKNKQGVGQAITLSGGDETVKALYLAMNKAGTGNISDVIKIDRSFFFGRADKIISPEPIPLHGEAEGYLFEFDDQTSATMVKDKLSSGMTPESVLAEEKKQNATIKMQKMKFMEGDPQNGNVYTKLSDAAQNKTTDIWDKDGKYYLAFASGPVSKGCWDTISQKLFAQYCATDDADKIIRDEIERLHNKHNVVTKDYEGNLRQAFKHLSSPEVLAASNASQAPQ